MGRCEQGKTEQKLTWATIMLQQSRAGWLAGGRAVVGQDQNWGWVLSATAAAADGDWNKPRNEG